MRLIPIFLLFGLMFASLQGNTWEAAKSATRDVSSATPTPTASPTFDPLQELTVEDALDSLLGSTDADCDGIPNRVDNCPITYNPDQKDNDEDKIGDACDGGSTSTYRADMRCDMDGDGIADQNDNCPITCNPDQKDANHNRIGDVCEGKRKEDIPLSSCRKRRLVKPPKILISNIRN